MSVNGQYILQLQDFATNIQNGWTNLQNNADFCDVTLVCDENQIQAHKMVVSTFSPVLRNILKKNTHQNPLIYLLGIRFSSLVNLLDFMYQGEIKIPQEEINDLLHLGRDLKVVGLYENDENASSDIDVEIVDKNEDDKQKFRLSEQNIKDIVNDFPCENTNIEQDSSKTKLIPENFSFSCDKCSYTANHKESLSHHVELHEKSVLLKSSFHMKEHDGKITIENSSEKNDSDVAIPKNDYVMDTSNNSFKTKTDVKVIGTIANGKNNCTTVSLETDGVTKNIEKIKRSNEHSFEESKLTMGNKENKVSAKKEGINLKLKIEEQDPLEYNNSNKEKVELNMNELSKQRSPNDASFENLYFEDLKDRKKNITNPELPFYNSNRILPNELSKKYKCDQCDTKYTQSGSLATHIKSVHEGVKFKCEKCPVTATQRASLKIHVQAVHDKIRYYCNVCDYSSTQKSILNKHVKIKH